MTSTFTCLLENYEQFWETLELVDLICVGDLIEGLSLEPPKKS